MATNEELSIAFLCFATRQQQSELIEFVNEKHPEFIKSENGLLFLDAVNMPFTEIPRKIAKLGASLYGFPQKQSIYVWMADKLASICNGSRPPLPLPNVRRKESASYDTQDHIMPVSLNLPRKE
jgi:hypothetical protein